VFHGSSLCSENLPPIILEVQGLMEVLRIPHQVIRSDGLIYMVLEYGDIDLARLLAKHEKAQREGGVTDLDENFIRLYWQQMLQVPVF
jgi:hypothetical protein